MTAGTRKGEDVNLYTLKDGDIEIKVITNLSEEEMQEAIEKKDELINYGDDEKYAEMTDYEVLEKTVWEQGDYIEDVTVAECKTLTLNEKLEVKE